MKTVQTSSLHNQAPRVAFVALVTKGQPPNGFDAGVMGEFAESYLALVEAYKLGGTPAVRKVWNTLVAAQPKLGTLLSDVAQGVGSKSKWTAREILETKFSEPEWAIPGVLPVGLNMLSGRPKLGKSWAGLQISVAVATGGQVFGQTVEKGPVLYLALEDSPRRLQSRLRKQGAPPTVEIDFHFEWKQLLNGGIKELIEAIRKNQYRLSVIDTLARVSRGAKHDDLDEMTALLGEIQSQAQSSGACVLLIDHHRKPSAIAPDPVDDIIGSTAKAAALDTVLGLYRERGRQGASLHIVGREVEERTLALTFIRERCIWELAGEAGEVQPGSRRGKIVDAIRELQARGKSPTTTAIAEDTGIDKANVSNELAQLVAEDLVVKGAKQGREQPYYLAESSATAEEQAKEG